MEENQAKCIEQKWNTLAENLNKGNQKPEDLLSRFLPPFSIDDDDRNKKSKPPRMTNLPKYVNVQQRCWENLRILAIMGPAQESCEFCEKIFLLQKVAGDNAEQVGESRWVTCVSVVRVSMVINGIFNWLYQAYLTNSSKL